MNIYETMPFLISQMATQYKVEIERELKELDLHSGQIFVLIELWKTDGLSQIEISLNLKISPPAINKMVKSLARNGFVISSPCPKDGRVVRVFLTPKGVAIRPKVEEKWRKLEESLVGNLTTTEQLVLSQLFGKLVENLTAKQ